MLSGKGYYKGSSVLVSGTAGTGKSSLAAHFVDAACRRGERVIYFTFEEPAKQIMRNMRSIGIDLRHWVKKGLLEFHATRPSTHGLEKHLLLMERALEDFKPKVVAVDPLNSFLMGGNQPEVKGMMMRLVNFMKIRGITSVFTSLTSGGAPIACCAAHSRGTHAANTACAASAPTTTTAASRRASATAVPEVEPAHGGHQHQPDHDLQQR
jgi:circadian clock protein KaiC